jgi:NAD(P)H dehydrogenase (quinone)
MAKVLIVYYSRGGATERMAQLVAEGAKEAGAAVTLKKVQDTKPDELLDYDAIVMGSPTYYGHMAAELKKLIDDSVKFHGRLAGKVGAAFTSSANIGGGNETTIRGILDALLIHGMVVQGIAAGDHYGPVSIGKPDERASTQCRGLGKRVAELAEKLFG